MHRLVSPGAFTLVAQRRLQNIRRASVPSEPPGPLLWPGLSAWRQGGHNRGRRWSADGSGEPEDCAEADACELPGSLAECGRLVLCTPSPAEKAKLTHAAFNAWCSGSLPLGSAEAPAVPARPQLPRLVAAKDVPTPAKSPLPLPAHLLHGLLHVELNAVDLAWDTVVRFSGEKMPRQFFSDFLRVADDESRHLLWCLQRMAELQHSYGDLPAHNVLWEGATVSAGDVAMRLAIVPCVQEARGLDAGPRIAERLVGAGDCRTAAIVRRISEEEHAHVAVGVAWLHHVAAARCSTARELFRSALGSHYPDGLRGAASFNVNAREKVGVMRDWWAPSTELEGRLRGIVEAETAAAAC